LAEREGIELDEAFERQRLAARSRRVKLHEHAAEIVNSVRVRATRTS
jgi:AmiR/NasT family two-component response regulator